MARHLAPARRGVVGRADRLQQHLVGRDAERERERAVAVVGEEPVVAGAQVTGEAEQQRFVAGAGDLEERPALLAQRDLAVVETARDERQLEVGDGFGQRCPRRCARPCAYRALPLALACRSVRRTLERGDRYARRPRNPADELLPWRRRAPRNTQGFLSPGACATRSAARDAGRPTSVVPFNNVRRRAATALFASKRTAPHALAVVAVDYTGIDAVRQEVGPHRLAVRRPRRDRRAARVPVAERERRRRRARSCTARCSLGIAVDLDYQGLVVPVIHDSDGMRLRSLAAAVRDVGTRARARQLGPDDLAGGTFTITNPGASGTWISFPDPECAAGRHPLDRRRREAGCRRRPRPAAHRARRQPLPDVRPPRARRRVRRRVPRPGAGDHRAPRLGHRDLNNYLGAVLDDVHKEFGCRPSRTSSSAASGSLRQAPRSSR